VRLLGCRRTPGDLREAGGEMGSMNNGEGARGTVEVARDASGARVVTLSGEIDLSNADLLGDKLAGFAGEDDHLVIDLSALEFMDSSGIAMLLRAAVRASSVEVRNPSDVVRRIIECTGLSDVLPIAP
jgi:stage II sporulation protein AA (anti-sigma F factor antagonist)